MDISDELYKTLRELAASLLQRERSGHTLQPTALANEAYLRLASSTLKQGDSRAAMIAAMTTTLRHVLVDHARRRNAVKRGGEVVRVRADLVDKLSQPTTNLDDEDILTVHDAVESLRARSVRQARLVELRFFGGLTLDEAAEALEVSRRTAASDWTVAKAFLRLTLSIHAGGVV